MARAFEVLRACQPATLQIDQQKLKIVKSRPNVLIAVIETLTSRLLDGGVLNKDSIIDAFCSVFCCERLADIMSLLELCASINMRQGGGWLEVSLTVKVII